jgi:hypothetical protein
MRMGWSAGISRIIVWSALCLYVLITLSSLDQRLQGDDHVVLWMATSIRFGDLPNRDFHDGGIPLQVLLTYVAQVATGHRPIGEVALQITLRAVGMICLYLVALRITGGRLVALAVLAPVALLTLGIGLYGAEKMFIFPVAALAAWRYLENPGRPWTLCAVTAAAFLLRHDHGVYVGLPLALAVVLSRRSLVPFVLGVAVFLLPWLGWVQAHEGVLTYWNDRVEFARLAGLTAPRPGFGIPAGYLLERRNALWLLWQLAVLTVVAAFATAAWRRDRKLLVLSLMACLVVAGWLRNIDGSPESAAAWALVGAWLVSLARRPGARIVATAWVVATVVLVLAVSEPREPLRRYLLFDGGLVARATRAVQRHSALPAIDQYAPADVTDERLIVRYVYRCLDPGEHYWDAAQWFPLSYYSEHPMLDQPNWRLGIRRSHDAEIAARLRAGTLPPLIVIEDESDPYNAFKHYPTVQALVREKYEPISSPAMDEFRKHIDNVTLLRDRSRQPTGRFAPLDLPCFARSAAGVTDVN